MADELTRFRILLVGRAGAGKRTILRNLCGEINNATVLVRNGNTFNTYSVLGTHAIENEISYRTLPELVFHDSRGLIVGSEEEMKTVEAFIARRRDMGLQGKIHIIWVCIPLDDERPVLRLFDLATGDVPVIGVFTKYDALETQALNNLRRQGRRKRNAFREMPEEAERLFQTNWLPLVMGGKYPPVAHVCLKNLDKSTGNCDDLRERTYEILRRRRVIMSPLEGRPNIVVEG
ncbi:hypothetical protein FRB95_001159 [Tulasnella sp. JGI-2019a]|nr:hypothetical protein FRB95_001159 [Tulasnella sp. JGI-2019a]